MRATGVMHLIIRSTASLTGMPFSSESCARATARLLGRLEPNNATDSRGQRQSIGWDREARRGVPAASAS